MSQPPPTPWKKGEYQDHRVFVIEVEVCCNKHGQVFSAHKLQDQDDHKVAMSMSSGGIQESAFALLQEALRREANLQSLICLGSRPGFKESLQGNSKEEVVEELAASLTKIITDQTSKLAKPVVQEMIEMLIAG